MKRIGQIIGWVLSAVFFILFIIILSLDRIVPAIPLLICTLLALPLFSLLLKSKTVKIVMLFVRGILIIVFLMAFIVLSFIDSAKQPLYKSPEVRAQLNAIYDAKLAQWPAPYELQMVDCEYGRVCVIISGPEDGPPVLLLHAASMANWSWIYNVAALSQNCRVFAIDYIGEPGKSELTDINHLPMDRQALTDLYLHVMNELGIEQSAVIGASFGGYIATCLAVEAPERVKKIALLGPMGITPATSNVNTKLIAYMLFPLKPFQDNMFHWALGDEPQLLADTEAWFRLVLTGVTRKGAPPMTFTPDYLQQVQAPALLILGAKDQLVGDPGFVKPLAENVPDIRIEVLPSGHLIGGEMPEETNKLLLEFLEE